MDDLATRKYISNRILGGVTKEVKSFYKKGKEVKRISWELTVRNYK